MSLRQWLLLCVPAFCWGSAFVFMEVALPALSPLMIVMGRMSVAAVFLLAVQLWPRQQTKHPHFSIRKASRSLWLQCAGLSTVGTLVPFGLVVWAQQYITASVAAILISVAPIFTVVLAVFVLKERLTLARGLGALLGFSGVILLIGPSVLQGISLQGAGELAILGAALAYSVAGFWGGRFKHIPPQALSTMTVSTGAVIIVLLGLGTSLRLDWSLVEQWQWQAGLAVLGLGLFSTAIAYLVYFRLLAEVGVVKTSLVSFLVPICTLLLSTTFLGERLETDSIIGMALILLGLAVLDGRVLRTFSLTKR